MNRRRTTRRGADRPSRSGIPLNLYMLQRRLGPAGVVTAALLLILLIVAQRTGWLERGGDWATYHEKTFAVTYVVDGDTLHVGQPDGDRQFTRVRLWGIDTPELKHRRDAPPDQPFAREAKEAATRLAQNKVVTLKLESHRQRDRFGRLLAYVILPDGQSLNEAMVELGLARADRRFSHSLFNHYARLEDEARRQQLGLWGNVAASPAPAALTTQD